MAEEKTLEQLLELANFYFLNSKFEEAEIEFYQVLKKDPKCWQAYCSLGLIYEEKKDHLQHLWQGDQTCGQNG